MDFFVHPIHFFVLHDCAQLPWAQHGESVQYVADLTVSAWVGDRL